MSLSTRRRSRRRSRRRGHQALRSAEVAIMLGMLQRPPSRDERSVMWAALAAVRQALREPPLGSRG
jgi:hypothetical protein